MDIVRKLKRHGIEFGKGWGFSLKVFPDMYNDFATLNIQILYGQVFIKLPVRMKGIFGDSYGFSWSIRGWQDMGIHLNWGSKFTIWDMPWRWTYIAHDVLDQSGKWVPYIGSWEDKGSDNRQLWFLPWEYTTKYGKYQSGQATCYIERIEWRMWFLKWLPIFRKVRTILSVDFDKEVGSEEGSWKGGVMSTGIDMLPHEEPWEALQRLMSSEKYPGRKYRFCR